MTLIKICGLTRAHDVRLARELGAWALGFVLADSPRRVAPEEAAELIALARLPEGEHPADHGAPHTVVVVTTEPPDWVAAALRHTNADGVQLSAGADGPSVARMRAAAARQGRRPLVIAAADTPDVGQADFVLLDARTEHAYGGTGTTLDWETLAADPGTPGDNVVLAGGLHPGNVGEAIAALRPTAVDVSGGVESAPRRKDERRLRDFFAAVEHAGREADSGGTTPPTGATTRRRTAG